LKNEYGLPAIDFEPSAEVEEEVNAMKETPEFIELVNTMKELNKS
jgi:hypothetical protein